MNLLKNITTASIAGVLLFSLSCDDRLPSESETAVETGSLELSYVFVHGSTSNPTIVGELLSDPDARTSVVVIARLLDAEGNGVNSKSLQFKSLIRRENLIPVTHQQNMSLILKNLDFQILEVMAMPMQGLHQMMV